MYHIGIVFSLIFTHSIGRMPEIYLVKRNRCVTGKNHFFNKGQIL